MSYEVSSNIILGYCMYFIYIPPFLLRSLDFYWVGRFELLKLGKFNYGNRQCVGCFKKYFLRGQKLKHYNGMQMLFAEIL